MMRDYPHHLGHCQMVREQPGHLRQCGLVFVFKVFIYLIAPGLTCDMQTL